VTKRSKTARLPNLIPAAAQKLFGRFPVARGEDTAVYEELVRATMEALQPKDFIEAILAQDVANHTWEIQRLRSIEATLLTDESALPQQRPPGLRGPPNIDEVMEFMRAPVEVLALRPKDSEELARFVQEFARQHPEKYERHLQKQREGPKSLDEIIGSSRSEPEPAQQIVPSDDAHRLAADAFKKYSREIDLISRLIALAESRRNAALRELNRYRSTRTGRARPEEITEVEYTEVPLRKRQRKP
jgi:hypothetical protein